MSVDNEASNETSQAFTMTPRNQPDFSAKTGAFSPFSPPPPLLTPTVQQQPASEKGEQEFSQAKMLAPQHKRIFKIIVIGDSNVGKTCLTYRFCGGKFLQRSEATIGVDFREKSITIGEETIKLQIWDTAGQERFRKSMISHYYRNVHAVLFVYDVTNYSSFESLSFWIEEFNKHCGTLPTYNQIPRLLVGNKCDLVSEAKVNTHVAQTFADINSMPLFETSAKDDSRQDHVEAIFMTLALKLKSARPFYLSNPISKPIVQPISRDNNIYDESSTNNSSNCTC